MLGLDDRDRDRPELAAQVERAREPGEASTGDDDVVAGLHASAQDTRAARALHAHRPPFVRLRPPLPVAAVLDERVRS